MPAIALPSSHRTSAVASTSLLPLSATARGKKRARFADTDTEDEASPPSPVSASMSNQEVVDVGTKTLKAQRSEMGKIMDGFESGTMRKGMYLAFINSALTDKEKGRMDRYNDLLDHFRPFVTLSARASSTLPESAPSVASIQSWLIALAAAVSRLDRPHSALVDTVLSLPWTVMDDNFALAYTRFAAALVTARSEWTRNVLDKIVKGFQYRSIPLEARSSLLPSNVSRRVIYLRLHSLLETLLRLVPTLPSTLWPLLEAHFPTKRDHRDAHICYVSNVLRIMGYCPELGESILDAVVVRAIKMDVEIQGQVEEWEDDNGQLEADIFGCDVGETFDKAWGEEMEDSDSEGDSGQDLNFDDLSSEDDDRSDEEEENNNGPLSEAIRRVKEMAAKLDAILRCIFDHLQHMNSRFSPTMISPPLASFPPTPRSAPEAYTPSLAPSPAPFDSFADEGQTLRVAIFDLLLSIFERVILRTHRTRHTQFLVFWYASLHPSFIDQFLGMLVETAIWDDGVATVTKVAATGYLASLVGRARYIDRSAARHVMTLLCARLEADLDAFGAPGSAAASTSQHFAAWYAVAQGVFYIFCFRWQDLLEEDGEDGEEDPGLAKSGGGRWLPALRIVERAISSHLNPLRACAPTVVAQFAKISCQVGFVYCYGITRANERMSSTAPSAPLSDQSWPVSPKKPWPSLPNSRDDSMSGNSKIMAQPPPTANPLVRQILTEAKMDSFFPFDPFKLPLSAPYIEHIYRVWEGGPGDASDDEGSEVDDEEEMMDDGLAAQSVTQPLQVPHSSYNLSLGGGGHTGDFCLGTSFEEMSISPRPRAPIFVDYGSSL